MSDARSSATVPVSCDLSFDVSNLVTNSLLNLALLLLRLIDAYEDQPNGVREIGGAVVAMIIMVLGHSLTPAPPEFHRVCGKLGGCERGRNVSGAPPWVVVADASAVRSNARDRGPPNDHLQRWLEICELGAEPA